MRFVIVEVAASLMMGSTLAAVVADSLEDKIKAYCALGACAGSLVFFLRNRVYERNDYAATLLWNLLLGVNVTPFICQYLLPAIGVAIGFNSCVAVSLVLAMSIPWILDVLCPDLGKKIQTFFRKLSIKEILFSIYGINDKGRGK